MKLLKDIVLPKLVDVLLLPDIDRQRQLMQHRTNPPIKAHNIIHIHKNPAIDRKKPPIPGQGINRIRKGQPRPITLALFIRHDRTDTERGKIALRRIQKNWEEVNQDYTLDYEIQSMRDLPSEVTSAS